MQLTVIKLQLLLLCIHMTWAEDNSTSFTEAQCKIPAFFSSKAKWETQIRQEKRNTGMYVRFTPDTITITDFQGVQPTQRSYDVLKCFGSDKFLAKLKDKENYVCFAIEQKSFYVLKWRVSESSDSLTDDICNEENLQTSKWPLIWPYYDKFHYETCPLKGGFNMKIVDKVNDKQLCENYWLSPRIDSECMTGEGMVFDFRHFECMGKLGLKIKQEVLCLGTWDENGYLYTVISNGDKLWPKLWLTRVSTSYDQQSDFDMEIFQDIQEDFLNEDDTNSKYYTLTLTQKVIESVYEDEGSAAMCKNDGNEPCNELQKIYCKKSCGIFGDILENCPFQESFDGTWETVDSNDHITQISIGNAYTVTTKDDVVHFKCLNSTFNSRLVTLDKYPVTASFDNGCKPRFSCLEMIKRSSSAITNRMSQKTVWPRSVDVLVMCSEENFEVDQSSTGNSVTVKHPHVMVKTEMENGEGRTGQCDIQLDKQYLKPAAVDNSWTILSLMNETFIRNNTCSRETRNNSVNLEGEENYWQCLAYFQEGSTEYLVVESLNLDMSPRSQCWISYKNERSFSKRFLVVYPYDCNDAAARYYGNDHIRFLSEYIVTTETNSGPPCSIKPTTSSTTMEYSGEAEDFAKDTTHLVLSTDDKNSMIEFTTATAHKYHKSTSEMVTSTVTVRSTFGSHTSKSNENQKEPVSSSGNPQQSVTSDGIWNNPVTSTAKQHEPVTSDGNWNEPVTPTAKQHEPVTSDGNWNKPVTSTEKQHELGISDGNWNKLVTSTKKQHELVTSDGNWNKPATSTEKQHELVTSDGNWNKPVTSTVKQPEVVTSDINRNKPTMVTHHIPPSDNNTNVYNIAGSEEPHASCGSHLYWKIDLFGMLVMVLLGTCFIDI